MKFAISKFAYSIIIFLDPFLPCLNIFFLIQILKGIKKCKLVHGKYNELLVIQEYFSYYKMCIHLTIFIL